MLESDHVKVGADDTQWLLVWHMGGGLANEQTGLDVMVRHFVHNPAKMTLHPEQRAWLGSPINGWDGEQTGLGGLVFVSYL